MPRGLILDEKEIEKIGDGDTTGEKHLQEYLGPQTPILAKKCGDFFPFFERANIFMNAAPNYGK